MENNSLAERMKLQYENRTQHLLPRRTYYLIRVDGRAFHTLTRKMKRPYDEAFMKCMDQVAVALCEEVQGALMAFVQSDEVSVLAYDFKKDTSDAWFDGNIQKIASVSASIATAAFNAAAFGHLQKEAGVFTSIANFDARVFTIPDPVEVENYFIWRQKDATRNSVQMAARAVYSHKEVTNKDNSAMLDMLMAKGINWNEYPSRFKRGRAVLKAEERGKDLPNWRVVDVPVFTQDRAFLRGIIPVVTTWLPPSSEVAKLADFLEYGRPIAGDEATDRAKEFLKEGTSGA